MNEQESTRSITSDTAKFYDAVASEFEADYYSDAADASIGYDVRAFEKLLRRCLRGLEFGCAIELGSGSGHWLRWLAAQGIPAVGVDISAGMCQAAAKAGGAVIQAEIGHLPVASNTTDLILSPYCALDHSEHFEAAFAELTRISTEDAVAVIMVDNAQRFISRYWHIHLPRVRSLRVDPRKDGRWIHDVDGNEVAVYTKMFSVDELRALLPGWELRVSGLGFLTPLVPHRLRRKYPRSAAAFLRSIDPLERLLCGRWAHRAALLVAIGRRR
jgi:SAM-dependent methyltransferase